MYLKINEEIDFAYSKAQELIMMSLAVLTNVQEIWSKAYKTEEIEKFQKTYRLLFECGAQIERKGAYMLYAPCVGMQTKEQNLDEIFAEFLAMDKREEMEKTLSFNEIAFSKEDSLDDLLEKYYEIFKDQVYLSYQTTWIIFHEEKRLIEDWRRLCHDLDTDAFSKLYAEWERQAKEEYEYLVVKAAEKGGLHISEEIMKKNFYNRGPYSRFVFAISHTMYNKAFRYWDDTTQVLVYNPDTKETDRKALIAQMKTIADETRINIIRLLSENGPMNGRDIASALGLAPSTVSHHVEQLAKAGILHEEPVKKSRYYSVKENCKEEFIRLIKEIFRQ